MPDEEAAKIVELNTRRWYSFPEEGFKSCTADTGWRPNGGKPVGVRLRRGHGGPRRCRHRGVHGQDGPNRWPRRRTERPSAVAPRGAWDGDLGCGVAAAQDLGIDDVPRSASECCAAGSAPPPEAATPPDQLCDLGEPRGLVDRVADHRVLIASRVTDVARHRFSGGHRDAGLDLGARAVEPMR